jgi:hypothetical protein
VKQAELSRANQLKNRSSRAQPIQLPRSSRIRRNANRTGRLQQVVNGEQKKKTGWKTSDSTSAATTQDEAEVAVPRCVRPCNRMPKAGGSQPIQPRENPINTKETNPNTPSLRPGRIGFHYHDQRYKFRRGSRDEGVEVGNRMNVSRFYYKLSLSLANLSLKKLSRQLPGPWSNILGPHG